MDEELEKILAFRRLSPLLASAGQPEPSGIQAIGRAGFKHLINLALPTSPGALADEAALAARAGLRYVHLPIEFEAPEQAQATRLFAELASASHEPVFVHCAKNMRVSALLSAYRMVLGGVSCAVARADLHAIWQPNHTWRRYVSNAALSAILRPVHWETERLLLREVLQDRLADGQTNPAGRTLELLIVEKASGEVVGSAGLRLPDSDTLDADLSYGLARAKWGKGIVPEACAKLLEVAFGWLGLHRVWASTDAENLASQRVLEKLGLRREAQLVQSQFVKGEHRDTLLYALTGAEYWATRT